MNEKYVTTLLAISAAVMILTAAIGGGIIAASDVSDDNEPESVQATTELGFIAGMIVMAAIGGSFSLGYFLGQLNAETYDPPAGSDESLKEYAREVAIGYTADSITILSNTVGMMLDSNNDTWSLAQTHLNRVSEISAATLWSSGSIYDPENVLNYAGVYGILADGLYNTSYAITYGLDNLANERIYGQSGWSSKDWGQSISSYFVWEGGQTAASSSALKLSMASIVNAGQSTGNRVYINTDGGNVTLYSMNGGTVTDAATGNAVLTMAAGSSQTISIPTGFYTLSAGTWASNGILPTVSADQPERCATVYGGAVIDVDGSLGFVTVNDDETMSIVYGGQTYTSSYLRYAFAADGYTIYTDPDSESNPDPLTYVIQAYADQMDVFADSINRAAVAGQTMWTISAQAGQANALLSPTSVSVNLANLGFDANQSYALYVSALSQISAYNEAYGDVLSAGQVKISAESLQLYCYGDVYAADGSLIAENVVMTPYVSVQNMTILSGGQTSTFTQDGTVMIWSTTSSGLADFDASHSSEHGAIVMPRGSYIVVDEMVYDGQEAPSVTLKVKEIARTEGLDGLVPSTDPDLPQVLSASTLVMIILIELAVIVALVGYAVRVPGLWLIALIIALLGIFIPDTIANWLLGVFGS